MKGKMPEYACQFWLDEIGDNIGKKKAQKKVFGATIRQWLDSEEKWHSEVVLIRTFKSNKEAREYFAQNLLVNYFIFTDLAGEFGYVPKNEYGIQLRECFKTPEKEAVIRIYYSIEKLRKQIRESKKLGNEIRTKDLEKKLSIKMKTKTAKLSDIPELSTEFIYPRIEMEISQTKNRIVDIEKKLEKIGVEA
jgi:hypothetical protein